MTSYSVALVSRRTVGTQQYAHLSETVLNLRREADDVPWMRFLYLYYDKVDQVVFASNDAPVAVTSVKFDLDGEQARFDLICACDLVRARLIDCRNDDREIPFNWGDFVVCQYNVMEIDEAEKKIKTRYGGLTVMSASDYISYCGQHESTTWLLVYSVSIRNEPAPDVRPVAVVQFGTGRSFVVRVRVKGPRLIVDTMALADFNVEKRRFKPFALYVCGIDETEGIVQGSESGSDVQARARLPYERSLVFRRVRTRLRYEIID